MTRPRSRGWPLRRQLVVVLIAVLLAFTYAVSLGSTLALRGQLVSQLDQQLTQAAERLVMPPPTNGPFESGGLPPSDRSDVRQFGPWIGQDAGTVVMLASGGSGEVQSAGYLTQDNQFTDLTTEQIAALRTVPRDGARHDVDIPGLGRHRAIATTMFQGDEAVIALPTASISETVHRYLVVQAVIGGVALLLTAAGGTVLVRRSLRPLEQVAGAASRVSELDLSSGEVGAIPRVDAAHTDERTEAGQVGAALNRMIDNVETSIAARHRSETHVRQFVADASHELRTPLASIRGYAELVRRSPDVVPPDASRALDRIESEATRMSSLVDDLLLLARLDAGRPLDRVPVDVGRLAVDALTDAHAAGPGHRWELDLPEFDDDPPSDDAPDAPDDPHGGLVVVGDEARLRQVLTNLLANARVHTPAGTRVVLRVRPDGGGGVVVTVADDGPGIPAALRPLLFRRFSRGDAARTRAAGSTGLGLAIVQSIVGAHGGTVAVLDSDAGATIEVRLPGPSAEGPAPEAPASDVQRPRS